MCYLKNISKHFLKSFMTVETHIKEYCNIPAYTTSTGVAVNVCRVRVKCLTPVSGLIPQTGINIVVQYQTEYSTLVLLPIPALVILPDTGICIIAYLVEISNQSIEISGCQSQYRPKVHLQPVTITGFLLFFSRRLHTS